MSEREQELRALLDKLGASGAPQPLMELVTNKLAEVLIQKVYGASVTFREAS